MTEPRRVYLTGTVNNSGKLELRDPYIAVDHAIVRYYYSRAHLIKLAKDGNVRSVKLSGTLLLLTEDIEDYAAGRDDRRGGNDKRRRDLE